MKKNNLISVLIMGFIASQLIPFSDSIKAETVSEKKPLLLVQETQTGLTEDTLTQIMTEIEQAEAEENIAGILEYLAPYVITSITVEIDNQKITTFVEGKDNHEGFLNDSFKKVKGKKVISSYTTTKINDSGEMALLTRVRAREVDTETGNRYLSLSTDKIRFAMIDNQPKIINIESSGWLEPISDQAQF